MARTGATADVHVRWFGEPLPATGVCYSCTDIWVWTEPGRRAAETALAHEIGHCVRSVGGDQDPGHTDPVWWGDGGHVQAAQLELVASGL